MRPEKTDLREYYVEPLDDDTTMIRCLHGYMDPAEAKKFKLIVDNDLMLVKVDEEEDDDDDEY